MTIIIKDPLGTYVIIIKQQKYQQVFIAYDLIIK